MGLRVTSTGLWFPSWERMRSPRKSTVEGKSKGPKRELGVCCHSGTGEEVSSLDTGDRGRGRNGGDPGVELLLRPSSTKHEKGLELNMSL